ncbi:MAG: DUF1266 domain-containing protein [Alphaproteobacteria bacterium]
MVAITEWAKQHPFLMSFLIIGFFVLIFGISVVLILMLMPKSEETTEFLENTLVKEIKEKTIIYKNSIHNFANNALNICISMGAPYAIANKQPVDIVEMSPEILVNVWKIKNKNALLNCLEQIRTIGDRRVDEMMIQTILQKDSPKAQLLIDKLEDSTDKKLLVEIQNNRKFFTDAPIVAWDIARSVMLVRSATDKKVGFLNKEEAKEYLLQIVEPIYRLNMGWETVGKGFLAGRKLWQIRQNRNADGMRNIVKILLENEDSPWLKQKRPSHWPKDKLEAPLFSPQDFDAMLDKYFLSDAMAEYDYVTAFHMMIEKASLQEVACFMNSFRYGLNYLSEGPLREVGHNLGLSPDELRGFSIAMMMGGMRVLSSLEQNIDHTMSQIADDILRLKGQYFTIDEAYMKLDDAVQNMVVEIFDIVEKNDKNLWGLFITIEELQAAREFGKSSYPEKLDWQNLPIFSRWVEQKLYGES